MARKAAVAALLVIAGLGGVVWFLRSSDERAGPPSRSGLRDASGASPAAVDVPASPHGATAASGGGAVPNAPFADDAPAYTDDAPAEAFFAAAIDARTKAPVADVPWSAALYDAWPPFEARLDTSPATVARHGGRRFEGRSDAQGRLRLDGSWKVAIVDARSGRLGGREVFERADPTHAVVELAEGVEVVATTVEGKPAAGLFIGVQSPRHPRWDEDAILDAEGRAYVVRPAFDVAADGWRMRPAVIGLMPHEGVVEVSAGRVEPVRIALPATGSLTVRAVDADGRPFRDVRHAWLDLLPGREPPADDLDAGVRVEPVDLRRGEARFHYVAVGKAFRVVAASAAEGRRGGVATFAGPRAAGDHVDVVVRCGEPAVVATGLVRFDDGAPAVGVESTVDPWPTDAASARADAVERRGVAVTGADGRYRVTLGIPRAPLPERMRVSARERRPGADTTSATATPSVGADGVVDLGVVTLPRAEVYCAGVVVDATGAPVGDAEIRLYRGNAALAEDRSVSGVTTDASGRFEIFRRPSSGVDDPRSVGAFGKGRFAFDPVPVRAGARDHRVVVRGAGALAGSFRFGGASPAQEESLAERVEAWARGPAAEGIPARWG
ncbi:MAG TPA: carboxypeptidase-like regulatory domain-containing protein, partial [Planctomycetota bacterium]|nr:carboxypeptidase-like regulatory domain-containing protein [Planctomycetota bacterium]